MRTLLLSALLVVTACCTSREAKAPTPPAAPDTVKPGAPTTLESVPGEKSVKLDLRFEGAGENVSVVASGIDGVTVTGNAELLSGAVVKAGEVRTFEVDVTRSGARGHLVISVKGTFGGASRARVHTVALGEGPPPPTGTKQVTTDGDAVKLMP